MTYRKTLFLNPPSFEGFDGGAGSRYQARREIRSFWYPTWLAQPAALVEGSRLVDAPARGLTLEDVVPLAANMLADDINRVTSKRPEVTNNPAGASHPPPLP